MNYQISPEFINFPNTFPEGCEKNRFILATCDYCYLKKNIDYLTDYEKSNSKLPYFCGIFFDNNHIRFSDDKLDELKNKYNLRKVILFGFSSRDLVTWLENQDYCEETIKYYQINFIRSARYILLSKIWKLTNCWAQGSLIKDNAAYVMDFDTIVFADFDTEIKRVYGNHPMLLSWDSMSSSIPDKFKISLSGTTLKSPDRIKLAFPHKVIKAGFSCFAPCELTQLFLWLFKYYSIEENTNEPLDRRLFSFYYGDQLSLLFAYNDLKNLIDEKFFKSIDWIDLSTSSIANLKKEGNPLLFIPKGLNK